MCKYTTGEMAKLCDVSVRTVQYYDSRGILSPSELSEGGRRIYSESDFKKMKLICYLRELGLSIESIKQIFQSEHPEKVVGLLLHEQEREIRGELVKTQERLRRIADLKGALQKSEGLSVEEVEYVVHEVKNVRKLKRMRLTMLLCGIPPTLLQWAGILLWIATGAWWLFAVWVGVATLYGVWASFYYFQRVAYICPECHKGFNPRLKEAFFANHTPKTRKLTCPHCQKRGFCVEIYKEKKHGD